MKCIYCISSARDSTEARNLFMFCGVNSIVSCYFFYLKIVTPISSTFVVGELWLYNRSIFFNSKSHRIISEHMIYELSRPISLDTWTNTTHVFFSCEKGFYGQVLCGSTCPPMGEEYGFLSFFALPLP